MSTQFDKKEERTAEEVREYNQAYSVGYSDGCVGKRGKSYGKLNIGVIAALMGYKHGYADAERDAYLD